MRTQRVTLDYCRKHFGRFLPAGAPRLKIGEAEYSGRAAIVKLQELTNARRVLLKIHGYNSQDGNVRAKYYEIDDGLTAAGLVNFGADVNSQGYEVVVNVSWPGGQVSGFDLAQLRVRGFGFKGVAELLRETVEALTPLSIDLMMHSLGNMVGLKAAEKGSLFRIRHMFCCAAAVDADSICKYGAYYTGIVTAFGRVLVFKSKHDTALGIFYRIAERGSRALGYAGPANDDYPRNVIVRDANEWSTDHGNFSTSPEFFQDVQTTVTGGWI